MSALPNPSVPPSTPQPLRPLEAPPPHEPNKRFPWPMLIGLAAIGLLGWYGLQWWTQPTVDTTAFAAAKTLPITTGNVERTLRVGGTTSAREFANVIAPILRGPDARNALYLSKVVKGGVTVKKGDVVAQIDVQSLLDRIDDVRDTVRQAENDITKRKAEQSVESEQLQQTLRVAKATWDKAKIEFQAGEVRTDVERELLKLAMEEAEAKYKQQLADVKQKLAVHTAEVKILELTAERIRRRLVRNENDLRRFTIEAPIDGLPVMQTLFRGGEMVQISEGDQINPGQPLMKIINQRTMQVEGNVNQSESGDIRLGQDVRVGFDSFPGLILRGKVSGLNALAVAGGRPQNYVRNIPIRVQLLETDPRVIPDLSAFGDIILEQASGVLRAPSSALVEEQGKFFLFVRSPQQTFERREVSIGIRSHTDVGITSGVKAGEEVRLN